MIVRSSVFAASIAVALAMPVASQEIDNRATRIAPISLQSGWNNVPDISGDGQDGAIVRAWRDNGNAHGYDLFTVLVAAGDSPDSAWNVVGFERDQEFSDTVRDAPHVGEDMVRSVRFSKGLFDGRPTTMAFVSTRDSSEQGIPHPTKAFIETFVLRANTEGSGMTSFYFERANQFRTVGTYCHAEMALYTELKIPLGADYAGQLSSDGC